jgi:hypothetical protein
MTTKSKPATTGAVPAKAEKLRKLFEAARRLAAAKCDWSSGRTR